MVIEWILIPLIKPILDFFNTSIFAEAFFATFYFEHKMGIDGDILNKINIIISQFASLLLTLKLLYKLFNIYILKIDGDATINPLEYLKSYLKGIIMILCFTVIYDWLYPIINDLAEKITALIGTQTLDLSEIITTGGNLTLFLIVYVVFVCIIYIHFLMNGVRMFVLRMGIPFACVGLIDNDNGIFSVFIKKIFQTSATVLVQMLMVQISILPLTVSVSFVSITVAIAILAYSLKVTSDLTEIFVASAGSGMGSKAASMSRGVGSALRFLKK